MISLSKEGKDAAGNGVNLDCLLGGELLAPAGVGGNPSHPVVPLGGKYMTGVVAPDLLPVLAAAAAHPPLPNPATILLALLAPLAPSRPPPPPPPDPKDASEVDRLIPSNALCERRDEERMDCALLQGREDDLGVREPEPPPRRRWG